MTHHGATEAQSPSHCRGCTSPRVLIVVAGAVLLAVLAVDLMPMRIAWHRWRMQSAWNAVHSPENSVSGGGMGGYIFGEDWEEYEYHRDQLVHLGEIHLHDFRFENIMAKSDESGHLLHRMMRGECPPNLYWSSPSPNSPAPLQLNLWCETADTASWKSFIAENDIANYEDQYKIEEREEHR